MATDRTGTLTSLGIQKYNTSADAPSGLGFNGALDDIDALLAARVTKPAGIVSGEVPVWNGTTWVRSSALAPIGLFPGFEYDYKEVTVPATSVAVTSATATAILTGNAVTYDGATLVVIKFYCGALQHTVANALVLLNLYDGATDLGMIARIATSSTAGTSTAVFAPRRLTPSAAAHTYSVRAWTTVAGTVTAAVGAGGAGIDLPMFMQITKV